MFVCKTTIMKHLLRSISLLAILFSLSLTSCGSKNTEPAAIFTVDAVTNKDYTIEGGGISKSKNPTLTLKRGETYQFDVKAYGHPFFIKTEKTRGKENAYNNGVINNGANESVLTFAVPKDAPNTLYYVCKYHKMMSGEIKIID